MSEASNHSGMFELEGVQIPGQPVVAGRDGAGRLMRYGLCISHFRQAEITNGAGAVSPM